MYIELKEIDKDTLKVGDVVGVAREVGIGYMSKFRHDRIIPAIITRSHITKISIEKWVINAITLDIALIIWTLLLNIKRNILR